LLGEKGYDEVFGARPLRRVIQNMIEDKLSESLLRGEFKDFKKVFEAEIRVNELTSHFIEAIKDISGAVIVKESEDLLIIRSSDDLAPRIKMVVGKSDDFEKHVKNQSYVVVVVDLGKDGVVIRPEEETMMLPAPVEALVSGDKKS